MKDQQIEEFEPTWAFLIPSSTFFDKWMILLQQAHGGNMVLALTKLLPFLEGLDSYLPCGLVAIIVGACGAVERGEEVDMLDNMPMLTQSVEKKRCDQRYVTAK